MSDTLQLLQTQAPQQQLDIIPIATILQRLKAVQQCMESAMQRDVHYGIIPGTQKPTLYQPGAQMLGVMFRLVPEFFPTFKELGNGHEEVISKCRLTSNGVFWGEGYGSCSTMESKYRFTNLSEKGILEDTVLPKSFWNLKNTDPDAAQKTLETMANGRGGEGVTYMPVKDAKGIWRVGYRKSSEEKAEHPNPYDHHNTNLKMGNKRAFICAILNATGASDMFTQDMEDLVANEDALRPREKSPEAAASANPVDGKKPAAAPEAKPAPKAEPKKEPITKATTREVALATVIPWDGWKRRCLGETNEREKGILMDWAQQNTKDAFASMILVAFSKQEEPAPAKEAHDERDGTQEIPDLTDREKALIELQEAIESQQITVQEFITYALSNGAWPKEAESKLSALPDEWLKDMAAEAPRLLQQWTKPSASRQPRKI